MGDICERICIIRLKIGKTYCAVFFDKSVDKSRGIVYNIKAVARAALKKITEVRKSKKSEKYFRKYLTNRKQSDIINRLLRKR